MSIGRLTIGCVLLAGWVTAAPLQVVCTTPDLADLCRQVGGAEVEVTSLAKGVEDPHFVEARPGFVRLLSRADMFVQMGMELELGYAPLLLESSRNSRLRPGSPGLVDASSVIEPLQVPAGPVDRSMGDVHPDGNPHYLLDPENGIKVAQLLAESLSRVQPASAALFQERSRTYAARLRERVAAWQAELASLRGRAFTGDHDLWVYFARRFDLNQALLLEPKPGVPPSTHHLQMVVARMKEDGIKLILTTPYFDPRPARFVAGETGARIVALAHQVGARPGTDTYEAMLAYNVAQLKAAASP